MLEIIVGFLFTISTGSYGFAWMIYSNITKKIETLKGNHLAHLEDRITRLERRATASERREGAVAAQHERDHPTLDE